MVQAMLGITTNTEVRPAPGTTPETLAARQTQAEHYAAKLSTGGFDEALTRALLYVFAADRALDQRCALALNARRQQLMRYSLADVKLRVRDQFFVLQLDGITKDEARQHVERISREVLTNPVIEEFRFEILE